MTKQYGVSVQRCTCCTGIVVRVEAFHSFPSALLPSSNMKPAAARKSPCENGPAAEAAAARRVRCNNSLRLQPTRPREGEWQLLASCVVPPSNQLSVSAARCPVPRPHPFPFRPHARSKRIAALPPQRGLSSACAATTRSRPPPSLPSYSALLPTLLCIAQHAKRTS